MFTGLVETMGQVLELRRGRGSSRLDVTSPWPEGTLAIGESIAVDGVCLTVVERGPDRFGVDVIAETLQRTTLGDSRAGRRVNLERSLRVGDRLGGHWVQGHVDTTAPVLEVIRRGGDHRVWIGLPPQIERYVALKGSIALQGVSLTVSALDAGRLQVALIPETLARTTLGELRGGERLNVEVDLLARYLERLARPGDEDER